MASRTHDQVVEYFKTQEGLNKIHVVKTGLENATITSFPQLFATVAKSNIQGLLKNDFYVFEKKLNDPGEFKYNEIEELAEFFNVDYDVIHRFIRNIILSSKRRKGRKKV